MLVIFLTVRKLFITNLFLSLLAGSAMSEGASLPKISKTIVEPGLDDYHDSVSAHIALLVMQVFAPLNFKVVPTNHMHVIWPPVIYSCF
jgi:hypothetical protein